MSHQLLFPGRRGCCACSSSRSKLNVQCPSLSSPALSFLSQARHGKRHLPGNEEMAEQHKRSSLLHNGQQALSAKLLRKIVATDKFDAGCS